MAWDKFKNIFGQSSDKAQDQPVIPWIESSKNPWGVRMLDVRPLTTTMLSTSRDPMCAANAISFGQEDGDVFINQASPDQRTVACNLRFPIQGLLSEGVLFIPREMEQKWALFYRKGKIICVRSWTRKVQMVADVAIQSDHAAITSINGYVLNINEEPAFTIRSLDFLIRSHALEMLYPLPLPSGMESDPKAAALWCMNLYGNRAAFATPHTFERRNPETPLRTYSLLHIAVARGDILKIEAFLKDGLPIDLLCADGLAPLHWALASKDPTILKFLLEKGARVDVRSEEGATPLMNAVQSGNADQVMFFLQNKADPNAQDNRGFTALHRAAEMGLLAIAASLIQYGAKSDIPAEGHTARSLAQARGNAEMVSLLDSYK